MLTVQYFLKALQNRAYEKRHWLLSVFSVSKYEPYQTLGEFDIYPMRLVLNQEDQSKLYFVDVNENDEYNLVAIEDYDLESNKALASFKDRIKLNIGDLANVTTPIETTYGNCIFNCCCLIYAFGDKFPFVTGKIDGGKIEKAIANNLHDTPKEGEPREKTKFYVDELEKHANAVNALDALSFTCVPTTSEKTMLPNPDVVKRRDELLKQYKDELHKPSVIAKIQAELASIDKESFKGDKAEGFYLGNKAYDITRMKKFGMMGLVGGFGGNEAHLLTGSLVEGYQPENIPALADDIRNGSYSRGKSTAIAGAGVKLAYNALQTVTIKEGDCGQTEGLTFLITKDNVGDFDGRYMITKTGLIELNKEIVSQFIGKKIVVRTPMLCKQEKPLFCSICAGKSLSMLPQAIHIVASDINSIYMNITMKSMHGKSLKTKRLNFFQ